jgi:hypothetical protein
MRFNLFEHLCLDFYNQGAGSRGTTCPQTQGELRSTSGFIAPPEWQALGSVTCSLCLGLYAIIFIELCFNFMFVFYVF